MERCRRSVEVRTGVKEPGRGSMHPGRLYMLADSRLVERTESRPVSTG
nr:MAG TPA: hypothetical protein [Caudoviricetes sp.]